MMEPCYQWGWGVKRQIKEFPKKSAFFGRPEKRLRAELIGICFLTLPGSGRIAFASCSFHFEYVPLEARGKRLSAYERACGQGRHANSFGPGRGFDFSQGCEGG